MNCEHFFLNESWRNRKKNSFIIQKFFVVILDRFCFVRLQNGGEKGGGGGGCGCGGLGA